MKRVEDVLVNVKRRRKALGYTLDEIAPMVKLSASAYHNLETGKAPITLVHLLRIAEALKIGVDKLFQLPL